MKVFLKRLRNLLLLSGSLVALLSASAPLLASATCANPVSGGNGVNVDCGSPSGYYCGSGANEVKTSIDFGCEHKGTALADATFAIIRFLSYGAGLILVGGMVYAGIQFSLSRGDPQLRVKAISRISNVVIALLVYIFSFAMLNYVIPAGFFK